MSPTWAEVPDRAAGYALAEADWDLIKDNLNSSAVKIAEYTPFSTANLDFSSIPQTYKHLHVVMAGRSSIAGFSDSVLVRLNGSTTGYDGQYMHAEAATFPTTEYFNSSSWQIGDMPATSAAAGLWAGYEFWLPDYTDGSREQNMVAMGTSHLGTTTTFTRVWRAAGYWRTTTAINQITIGIGAANFANGSYATLYGYP